MSLLSKLKNAFKSNADSGRVSIALSQSQLTFCHTLQEEAGGFSCASQNITAPEEISQNLKALVESEDVSGDCVLMLASGQYHLVQVEAPKVPEAELNGALIWQVKDLVPIAPDDLLIDYYQLPLEVPGNTKLNVVCASKSQVKQISDVLFDEGLALKVITIPEFSYANLLPVSDDASLFIYKQPNEELSIIIVKQGLIYFSRNLRGFKDIGAMGLEQLSYGVIDSLSLEIQRSIDYFERQLKQAPIKQIDILIPFDNEKHLVDMLAQNTHLPVKQLVVEGIKSEFRPLAGSYGALAELPSTEGV